ncbi:HPr kinase/phosphorylase [Neoaquamicrobium sediminum]|uniref:HPr kinase/phosphorylase n=1 Tax=Neoaquamicrobium sediminum TaxID=1849104 RepID=A0ABV3WMV4_9HYPH
MGRTNLHATALVAGESGLLITGRSGAGKSLLAAGLVETLNARGDFAVLVSDDQVWVESFGARLIAEAPDTIAGMIELRGYGPARAASEKRAVMDRMVALVEPAAAPRYREAMSETVLGVCLPCLALPERNVEANVPAILAWLAGEPG